MGVHLVCGVPNQAVFGAVEHAVRPKVSSTTPRLEAQVSAPLADDRDDGLSRLSATWATSSRDRDFRSAGWSTRSSILPPSDPPEAADRGTFAAALHALAYNLA